MHHQSLQAGSALGIQAEMGTVFHHVDCETKIVDQGGPNLCDVAKAASPFPSNRATNPIAARSICYPL